MTIKNKLIQSTGIAIAFFNEIYSKNYTGPMENFVHGYAHDVTFPFGLYFLNKLAGNAKEGEEWANAAFVFLGGSFFEVLQGFKLFPGTFDPKDFLAYAAGTGLAVAIDKLTSGKETTNTRFNKRLNSNISNNLN
ncbi:hypothetical protein HY837_00250 [archaeon]|nr:hypothetical protein [archaeon]